MLLKSIGGKIMELNYTIIYENDYEEMENIFNGKKWYCYLPSEKDEDLQNQALALNECLEYLGSKNDIYIVKYKEGLYGFVSVEDFEPFNKHIVLVAKKVD